LIHVLRLRQGRNDRAEFIQKQNAIFHRIVKRNNWLPSRLRELPDREIARFYEAETHHKAHPDLIHLQINQYLKSLAIL
jgi:hypothetical protein